jgi:hypothetical protein
LSEKTQLAEVGAGRSYECRVTIYGEMKEVKKAIL